jgi:enterochelin esterase family protein
MACWSGLAVLCLAALLAAAVEAQTPSAPEGVPAPSNVRGREYPRILPDLRVVFRVRASEAHAVSVAPKSADSGLGAAPYAMTRGADGNWRSPPRRSDPASITTS